MSDNKYWVCRVAPCYGSAGDYDYHVEVAHDFEATSPDALGVKYKELGEGEGYEDPREAATAAIKVAARWAQDESERIGLAWQTRAGGYFGVVADEADEEELKSLAEKEYESIPKCARCGDILGKTWYHDYFGEDKYCSEFCATETMRELDEDDPEWEEDYAY